MIYLALEICILISIFIDKRPDKELSLYIRYLLYCIYIRRYLFK